MALERKVKLLFLLVVLANLVIVLVMVIGALEPKPPKPMPNPNGYDDFVRAGKLFVRSKVYWAEMSRDELRAHVSSNSEAIKLLQIGMSHECRVPNDFSRGYIGPFTSEISPLRYLGQVLCANGQLDLVENRTNEAVQCFLEDIQFGEHWSRGGWMVCKLIGIGSEFDGRKGLAIVTSSLDTINCRKVIQALELLDANEEQAEEYWIQEKAWARKTGSFRERIGDFINYKQVRKEKDDFYRQFHTNQILRREMMLTFAARAYELEKGKKPVTAADLVPGYLKAIPKDPATGTNLVLRANAP